MQNRMTSAVQVFLFHRGRYLGSEVFSSSEVIVGYDESCDLVLRLDADFEDSKSSSSIVALNAEATASSSVGSTLVSSEQPSSLDMQPVGVGVHIGQVCRLEFVYNCIVLSKIGDVDIYVNDELISEGVVNPRDEIQIEQYTIRIRRLVRKDTIQIGTQDDEQKPRSDMEYIPLSDADILEENLGINTEQRLLKESSLVVADNDEIIDIKKSVSEQSDDSSTQDSLIQEESQMVVKSSENSDSDIRTLTQDDVGEILASPRETIAEATVDEYQLDSTDAMAYAPQLEDETLALPSLIEVEEESAIIPELEEHSEVELQRNLEIVLGAEQTKPFAKQPVVDTSFELMTVSRPTTGETGAHVVENTEASQRVEVAESTDAAEVVGFADSNATEDIQLSIKEATTRRAKFRQLTDKIIKPTVQPNSGFNTDKIPVADKAQETADMIDASALFDIDEAPYLSSFPSNADSSGIDSSGYERRPVLVEPTKNVRVSQAQYLEDFESQSSSSETKSGFSVLEAVMIGKSICEPGTDELDGLTSHWHHVALTHKQYAVEIIKSQAGQIIDTYLLTKHGQRYNDGLDNKFVVINRYSSTPNASDVVAEVQFSFDMDGVLYSARTNALYRQLKTTQTVIPDRPNAYYLLLGTSDTLSMRDAEYGYFIRFVELPDVACSTERQISYGLVAKTIGSSILIHLLLFLFLALVGLPSGGVQNSQSQGISNESGSLTPGQSEIADSTSDL